MTEKVIIGAKIKRAYYCRLRKTELDWGRWSAWAIRRRSHHPGSNPDRIVRCYIYADKIDAPEGELFSA